MTYQRPPQHTQHQFPHIVQTLAIPGHPGQRDTTALAWSPDHRWLTASHARTIWLYDLLDPDRPPRHLQAHQEHVRHLTFDFRSSVLASVGLDGAVYVWDVVSGTVESTVVLPPYQLWTATFHPTTPLLAVGGGTDEGNYWCHGVVALYHVHAACEQVCYQEVPRGVSTMAFHPREQTLAYALLDCTLHQWDVQNHRNTAMLTGPPAEEGDRFLVMTFHPEGRTLVTVRLTSAWEHWQGPTAAPTLRQLPHPYVKAVAVHPAGQTIAYGMTPTWHPLDPDILPSGESELRYRADGQVMRVHPQDSAVVTVRTWTTHADSPRPLRGHQGTIHALVWRADGQQLAVVDDHTLYIWELAH
jgi:WD40 repeat protein